MIKAILFDMDGILYDSEKHYMQGTIALMRSLGFQGDEKQIYRIIGTSMAETYHILYELLGGAYTKEEIEEFNTRYFSVINPINFHEAMFIGVPEALACFKEHGLKLACCSSSSEVLIRSSLQELDLLKYFDFIQSGESIENPKPAPDTYLYAARELAVNLNECIVYEDSYTGISAGKRAGIFTIAREDNRFGQDQSNADLIVKTIQDVVKYVLGGGRLCNK